MVATVGTDEIQSIAQEHFSLFLHYTEPAAGLQKSEVLTL